MLPKRVALVASMSLLLVACPDGGQSSGGTTPQSGGGNPALANLEASPFMNEVWINEQGMQEPFIFYPREGIRLSARCRTPQGQLACEAIQYLRFGMPVDIPRRSLDGRTSAGVKVCMKMSRPITVVRNSVGAEDSMCRFGDGSLIANGALERYAMRVIE